jgi:tRNA G18 (ribose-2'-O)-methylase SpoU
VRNSTGTVFRVPVIHATGLATSLRWLQKNRHTRAVVADGHASKRLQDGDLRGNVCIFARNEDTGVSQPVKDLCDERLAIRMENGVDSLNVASAVAVFLFEARRQRELHQREMATDAETSQRH